MFIALLLLAALAYDLIRFDKAAWQADYARLKQGLAQGYANMDWQVDHREMDLAVLDGEISARLEGAVSHVQAYLAISDFVGRFDDPHLQLHFGTLDPAIHQLPEQSAVEAEWINCTANGYRTDDFATSLAYRGAENWRAVADGNFPAGIIGATGIIRIAEFGEQKYRGDCSENPMDPRELQLATRVHLNNEFSAILSQLRKAGATRLAIDVTGNGGGSEWASELAAMLATGTLTRRSTLIAAPDCDRATIWQGQRPCPIYRERGDTQQLDGESLWPGPMAVLIDGDSASATEDFAAWLSDNDQAVLVGETSLGAGCGYISGGNAVQLAAAPLYVMMPNCTRLMKDGRNEMEGLAPDVPVDWQATTSNEFADLFEQVFAD